MGKGTGGRGARVERGIGRRLRVGGKAEPGAKSKLRKCGWDRLGFRGVGFGALEKLHREAEEIGKLRNYSQNKLSRSIAGLKFVRWCSQRRFKFAQRLPRHPKAGELLETRQCETRPCRIIFKIAIRFSEKLAKTLRSEYLSNEVGIVREPFE